MNTVETIMLMIGCIILASIFVWGLVKYDYNYLKKVIRETESENGILTNKLNHDFSHKAEMSDKLLSFIEKTCAKIAVIHFQDFIDANDVSKITKQMLMKVVSSTAKQVHESITLADQNIIDETLYTPDFVNAYIIDCCIMHVKSLLNEHIDELTKINP